MIKMIKEILKLLFRKEIKFIPNSFGEIGIGELRKKLGKGNWYLTDGKFKLTNLKQMMDWLIQDKENLTEYKDEINDCDNFAIQLAGRLNKAFPNFVVGYAQSSSHAFNIFMDENKKIWFIEPQSNTVFYSNAKRYKLKMVLI